LHRPPQRMVAETAQPHAHLFAIRPDGTDVRQLSDSRWEAATPAWKPG
jgi:hypothetical protein